MVMIDGTSCKRRLCNKCDMYRKELEERDKGCDLCNGVGLTIPLTGISIYAKYDVLTVRCDKDNKCVDEGKIRINYCPLCGRKLV